MISSMRKFWGYAIQRGDIPQPIWGVVSTGGQQPIGHVIAWSVNKSNAEQRMSGLEGHWRLERFEYKGA